MLHFSEAVPRVHRCRHGGRGAAMVVAIAFVAQWSPAHAGTDIEVPTLVFDTNPAVDVAGAQDDEIDLANIVQSVARGVTTAQEAPAIVTVVTSEEIRSRGLKDMQQVIDSVPGWMRWTSQSSQPMPLTRGVRQASLFMHDGLSLFDPFFNFPSVGRVQSLETVKRIELVTGPGGVLWGANSFLGIVNVISKDAADIDGIEANVSAADGDGDHASLRGYVLAGVPDLFDDRAELVLHTSFETFRSASFELPSKLYQAQPPQPAAPSFYGPLTRAAPKRSMVFNVDGKVRAGALSLAFQVPFVQQHDPIGLGGFVARETWPEDSLELPGMPGVLACPFGEPYIVPGDRCLDKGRNARDHRQDFFERYLVASYQRRSDDGLRGVALKAYGVQFVRNYAPAFLNAVPVLLEGGLGIKVDATSYRAGTSLDGDLEVGRGLRLLYGAEVFREWVPDDTTTSRQGAGRQSTFNDAQVLERLPQPCPREPDPDNPGVPRLVSGCPLTFAFAGSRTVAGVYFNPQWRPTKALILDAGARLQVAPSFASTQAYDLTPTFSGALVYRFLPDWHVKLNYAEGFRPPVYNNTNSNGEAAAIDGGRDLAVETSDAVQAEINARLFKGQRRLREISFRVDYSYTRMQNYIEVVASRYENSGDRAMHSAEALVKVHVQGGHRLELGYTFLRMVNADIGVHKALPEHWFNLAGIIEAIPNRLQLATNLRVLGAMEDPDLMVEYRDLGYDEAGGVIDVRDGASGYQVVEQHELVMDRLPPGAQLDLGVTVTPSEHLRINATAFNVLNARYFRPDPFSSYEQYLYQVPNSYEDFSARVSVTYDY